MVEIRLCNRPGSQISFISVPPDDIRRLAIHPLKWLRFVLFAISGAQGHLATTPTGPPVDYTTPFDDLAGTYYYLPEGQIMLVDHQALNDRVTSSDMTPRRHNFKGDVLDRDHHCIITQVYAIDCDAAHIIPKSKGDDYIQNVISLRSRLYPSSDSLPSHVGINDVRNGMLLSKGLHAAFARGDFAFIKTPNFALDPDDIPRVERDPADLEMPASRTTLQFLRPVPDFDLAQNSDTLNTFLSFLTAGARFPANVVSSQIHLLGFGLDTVLTGTGRLPPPAILLDYMYGVSAYRVWKTAQSEELMKNNFTEYYDSIPIPSSSDNDSDCKISDDNKPRTPPQPRQRSSRMGDGLVHAIDELNAMMMYLSGTSPQMLAEQLKSREEEEQSKAQKASEVKVMEWLENSSSAIQSQTLNPSTSDDHIATEASVPVCSRRC